MYLSWESYTYNNGGYGRVHKVWLTGQVFKVRQSIFTNIRIPAGSAVGGVGTFSILYRGPLKVHPGEEKWVFFLMWVPTSGDILKALRSWDDDDSKKKVSFCHVSHVPHVNSDVGNKTKHIFQLCILKHQHSEAQSLCIYWNNGLPTRRISTERKTTSV